MSELVVTGSRIPQSSLGSASPVTQLTTDDIENEGVVRVEDAINRLPQAFVDQNSTITSGPTGTATVNLRDLGAERTLVLIDGKRLMPGDPTAGSVAPDLNFIPDALVERIDVVTGGASAVYGSDAVAGVVNFIMKRDLSGVLIDAKTGVFDHGNHDSGLQAVLAADNVAEPAAHVDDGLASEVTVAAGANAPDDRGNITVYGAYRQAWAVTESTRDFSACSLEAEGSALACQGSFVSPATGSFIVIDPATFNVVADLTLDPTGPGNTLRPLDPLRDGYNFAPYEYLQRPDQRWSAGVFAHYSVAPSIEVYADGMFMYDASVGQLAPSGLFTSALSTISCANPMLSAAEVEAFCTDVGLPSQGNALVAIGYRDVTAGGRQNRLTHTDYRFVAGVRGAVGDWSYDVSAQYGQVAVTQLDLHDVSLTRAMDALDVINVGGKLVCASGNAGCAPYDVFQLGAVTPAALAYIEAPGQATGGTSETVVSANLTGKLGRYGVRSRWADDPVGVAVGAEWRREGLDYAPDAELASGDLTGAGAASPAVSGDFSVAEVYGEVRAPVIQHRGPLLDDLSIEAGYRYSWYTDVGAAETYKVGVVWAIDPAVRLRASFNHAVRAPNVVELFTPRSISAGLDFDPCAGANPIVDEMDPFATAANCARTGVSPAQYGHIAESPGGYNALSGGNPDLRPEAANTWTLGVVVTPPQVPDLNLTVDYYDIRLQGMITVLDPDVVIEQCLETGSPFLCSQIHRAPGTGSLWISNAGYVADFFQNSASLATRGFDIDLRYRRPIALADHGLGVATFSLTGTYLMSLQSVTEPGASTYDCAGYYGLNCEDPVPRWRHVASLGWETPWKLDLSLAWRYTSAVLIAAASPNAALTGPFDAADYRMGARSYFDLSLDWRATKRLEFRVGVNNIFDTDPPVVGADPRSGVAANANTYTGVYDALGRWVFVSLTAKM